MDDSDFDQILGQIRKRPIPEISPGFTENVWREIRGRREVPISFFQYVFEVFLRPRFLAGSVALLVVVSVTLPAALARAAGGPSEGNLLGLDVFSSRHSPALLTRMP